MKFIVEYFPGLYGRKRSEVVLLSAFKVTVGVLVLEAIILIGVSRHGDFMGRSAIQHLSEFWPFYCACLLINFLFFVVWFYWRYFKLHSGVNFEFLELGINFSREKGDWKKFIPYENCLKLIITSPSSHLTLHYWGQLKGVNLPSSIFLGAQTRQNVARICEAIRNKSTDLQIVEMGTDGRREKI